MSDVAKIAGPAPMEGHGRYNRSSRVQATGLSPALPLLEQAARTVDLVADPIPIVVADFGASQGRNSLAPMMVAIHALRDRVGPERAISVVHTDLPDSDFTALFQLLDSDPDSYLRLDPVAFAFAVGRSFYKQILPTDSVTLGWSSWAIQWLSRLPTAIPDQLQIALSSDLAACAAFARQADEDWRSFLLHRGREMRAGAKLVVLTMARDATGEFGYRPLLEAMYATLMELIDERLIDVEEARGMAIPTVGRTQEEFLAPFAQNGRFAGLVVEHFEIYDGEDGIWLEFERNGDAQAFGAQWAAFSRASVFPTLAAELRGGDRDPRAGAFIARMEAGVARRLANAPAKMKIPLARMLFAKPLPSSATAQ